MWVGSDDMFLGCAGTYLLAYYSIATYFDRPADLSRDIECKDRESTREDCNRDVKLLLNDCLASVVRDQVIAQL